MYYCIYKITNKLNGMIYIGAHQTSNLEDGYMGSGIYLRRAQAKHGLEHFTKEILFTFDTLEEMFLKESEIVNQEFINREDVYNLNVGGFGGFHYIQINKLNCHGKGGLRGEAHQFYGKKRLENSGVLHYHYGKKRPEHSVKMMGSGNPRFGKPHSQETKDKISAANLGRKHSDEVNKKKARYGEDNNFSVKGMVSVLNLLTLEGCRVTKEEFEKNKGTLYVGIASKIAKELLNENST